MGESDDGALVSVWLRSVKRIGLARQCGRVATRLPRLRETRRSFVLPGRCHPSVWTLLTCSGASHPGVDTGPAGWVAEERGFRDVNWEGELERAEQTMGAGPSQRGNRAPLRGAVVSSSVSVPAREDGAYESGCDDERVGGESCDVGPLVFR